MIKKIFISVFILIAFASNAQVEMASNFRGEGKIYVVVAIVLAILLGFFVLLIKLDRKTKRLEKELKEK